MCRSRTWFRTHRLLPTESIRFFTSPQLDRRGGRRRAVRRRSDEQDRAQLQGLHATLRAALDRHERRVWAKDAGAAPTDGPAEVVTASCFAHARVSGWPGLHVRASHDGRQLQLLRMERLAPAVLLVLLDGIPDRVVIEEPVPECNSGVIQCTRTALRITLDRA
jgi:hypothetical protein